MTRVLLVTEVVLADGSIKRTSSTEHDLNDGDTVAGRIIIGQDETGAPMVQLQMLGSTPTAEPAPRADA